MNNICNWEHNGDEAALVCIHGWKGDANTFLPLLRGLNIPKTTLCFPQAPHPESEGYSWSTPENGGYHIQTGIDMLNQLFEQELFPNFDSNKIFVLGFSQGAMMIFEQTVQLPLPLGGLHPYAGFLSTGKLSLHPSQQSSPVIVGHGRKDDIVLFSEAEKARDALIKAGAQAELWQGNGGHKLDYRYLTMLKENIRERIG